MIRNSFNSVSVMHVKKKDGEKKTGTHDTLNVGNTNTRTGW